MAPHAELFRADPLRTDDPVLNRIDDEIPPGATVLDVGGGAGRFALPLALRGRIVTVVEPSSSMLSLLEQDASANGVSTVSTILGGWPDVHVDIADVVLCAGVVHGISDIKPFIQALVAHAPKRVLVLASMYSPLSLVSPFWERVHGEPRIDQPGLAELVSVLWELGIYPDVRMFEPSPPATVAAAQAALGLLRGFLYVAPNTAPDRRLQSAMADLLVQSRGGLTVRNAAPRRQALVSWRPAHLS